MLSPVATYSAARTYVVLFFFRLHGAQETHVDRHRCLFALTPHICPLCRKRFDPSKAKKLHVDRPEFVDENKEHDLLQRMALSSEAPQEQLQELTHEVDSWLETRADDTVCVDCLLSNDSLPLPRPL